MNDHAKGRYPVLTCDNRHALIIWGGGVISYILRLRVPLPRILVSYSARSFIYDEHIQISIVNLRRFYNDDVMHNILSYRVS